MTGEPRYFIVVTGPSNWEKTSALGWSQLGMKSTRRKLAMGFKPGDKVVAYYTGLKQFGALLTVEGEPFEDHERIWASPDKPNEDYPYRVRTSPEIVLPPGRFIDAQPLSAQMGWTQKWPAANWTLAYQGNIHPIPEPDFHIIRTAMASVAVPAPNG